MENGKNAIISAWSKDGIEKFAKFLVENGYNIYSTSGTLKYLKEKGIDCLDASNLAKIPEMFNGRLKTLSSYLLGGILALDRNDPDLSRYNMVPIDLVMVSLYDFIDSMKSKNKEYEEMIELIDIGGVTLLRAAAKNYTRVIVVPGNDYMEFVMDRMKNGELSLEDRKYLASETFHLTSYYDYAISSYFGESTNYFNLAGKSFIKLRYGENPHQKARTYNLFKPFFSVIKEGKELSYNNILDAWTAWELVNRLDSNSCVVIKHNYPCGAATGDNSLEMAFMSDEVSAYGGILACNRPLKKDDWHILKDRYIEVVIAPDYENELLNAMEKKKNLRVLRGHYDYYNVPDLKIAGNIILEQEWNVKKDLNFKIETGNPPAKILNDLIFGWELVKTLKSNAVAIVKDLHLKSSGAGQPNRVDSVRIALEKAKSLGRIDDDSLLISDGFFPFVDNLELIHEFGIKNVAAPLGSIRDNEILKYASYKGLNFISVGERAFKH